jgi:aldose 1-epimerase
MKTWIPLIIAMLMLACAKKEMVMKIESKPYGALPDGQTVQLFVLENGKGMKAEITNYGGIVTSLYIPDRNGAIVDVVLGYDHLSDYLKSSPYFGSLVGRFGNRIAGAKFTLDGVAYKLAVNNGPNHLHGGLVGFDKVVWGAEPVKTASAVGLKLTYLSKDGEEGYPGNLNATVTYWLTASNELKIEYQAQTNKATIVNLTHHGYFNLAGQGQGDILNHEMMINAGRFTPVNTDLIPIGELRPVKDSPMDFTTPWTIGARINADDEQVRCGGGYDHNFVLNHTSGELGLAARVSEPSSGRVMEVYTTEPGLQFYTGNFLDGTLTGKGGKIYKKRYGFCLESQHFPDSPNQPDYPSVVLRPGQTYRQTTIYKFLAK